jgi:ATP-dependent protease ClpP protease subunit
MTVDLDRVRAMLDRRPEQQARPTNLTATARTWYRITNAGPAEAEVWIYDEIGAWGITAGDFVAALTATQATDLTVHINSPGGEVWDGLAIYHALRAHPATVTVSVDGAALSAASFIAMAGDRIVTAAQSQWMIHDASGLCMGTSDDMAAMSEVLDQLSQMIAEIYHDRARGGVAKWRGLMRAGSWFPAQAAVDAGLADEVGVVARRSEEGEPATAGWAARPTAAGAVPAAPAAPDGGVVSAGTGKHDPAAASPPSLAAAGLPPDPGPAVSFPALDPGVLRAAVARAANLDFDPSAFRDAVAAAGRDVPAPAPAAAGRAFPATPREPAPAPPEPAPEPTVADRVRDAVGAAAHDVPAPVSRPAAAVPSEPAPAPATPEPEPERPLSLAEFIRSAVGLAAVDVPAPAPSAGGPANPPPDPPPGPAIDSAAFARAVEEASL